MSVPFGTARERYVGTGSTGPFAFNYKLYEASHLTVAKTDVAGIDTYLDLGVDYSVALAADMSSATVTLTVALAGDGIDDGGSEILTIVRDPPISQLIEWPRNDPFPSATHERAADLAVMLIDRINEKIQRSLLLPESSVFSGLTLPNPVALNFLRWNAAEDALENATIADAGTLIVSPFMTDVLDEVDASAVRSKLALGNLAVLNSPLGLANGGTGQTTASGVFSAVKQTADETNTGVLDLALSAEIFAATPGAHAITAEDLETAAALVSIADGATITPNWDLFIFGQIILAGNRTLANPINLQVGTWRNIWIQGNDGTDRTIALAGGYLGPHRATWNALTFNSSNKRYVMPILALNNSDATLVGAPLGPF